MSRSASVFAEPGRRRPEKPVGCPQCFPAPPDASSLADEVRQLARLAHRLLNDPATEPRQLDCLARRIGQMRSRHAARPGTPVARWLDHLEARVPAATV